MSNDVAAVLVTFNRKKMLVECLEALLHQTSPVAVIYLVDNASTDGTREYLRERGYLDHALIHYLLLPKNLGGAGGFTTAMKAAYEAGHSWLWLMDDDAEPHLDALEAFRPYMEDRETAALGNLKLDTLGRPLIYHLGAVQWRSSLALVVPITPEKITSGPRIRVDFCSFVGLMVKREAITRIGFPRAEFFIHNDDVEFSIRLVSVGKIYLIPASTIDHKEDIISCSTEKHFGAAAYRRVSIEKYAMSFFGVRNSIWVLLHHSPDNLLCRHLNIFRDVVASAVKILLYERDYRLLRLRLLFRAAHDGILGRFDNTLPFRVRKQLSVHASK